MSDEERLLRGLYDAYDGALLAEGRVVQVWTLHGGLVVRMDVEEPGA